MDENGTTPAAPLGSGSLRQHRHATRIARRSGTNRTKENGLPRELMCINVQDSPIMV